MAEGIAPDRGKRNEPRREKSKERSGRSFLWNDDRVFFRLKFGHESSINYKKAEVRMRVLLVDDFATMRKIIRNVLKQINIENVVEAENGKQALSILKNEKIDLIISDWIIPEMSGIEFLRACKQDERIRGIPFIVVTAEAQKNSVIEAINIISGSGKEGAGKGRFKPEGRNPHCRHREGDRNKLHHETADHFLTLSVSHGKWEKGGHVYRLLL